MTSSMVGSLCAASSEGQTGAAGSTVPTLRKKTRRAPSLLVARTRSKAGLPVPLTKPLDRGIVDDKLVEAIVLLGASLVAIRDIDARDCVLHVHRTISW